MTNVLLHSIDRTTSKNKMTIILSLEDLGLIITSLNMDLKKKERMLFILLLLLFFTVETNSMSLLIPMSANCPTGCNSDNFNGFVCPPHVSCAIGCYVSNGHCVCPNPKHK